MNVKYRSYGENRPLMLLLAIVIASFWIFIGIDELFKIKFAVFWRVLVLHFLLLIALGIMAYLKSRFIADDYSVTFMRVLSRKITINYIDIDEITVYNELKRTRRQYTYHNFYVEVIAFKTLDGKDYVFRNIMDINPDSHVGAMLGMNKIFEMGKFKTLQRFIEQKKKAFYSPDYHTVKRS